MTTGGYAILLTTPSGTEEWETFGGGTRHIHMYLFYNDAYERYLYWEEKTNMTPKIVHFNTHYTERYA